MGQLEDIQYAGFTAKSESLGSTVTFLPEPDRRDRKYTIISVDDHIVEPPDMFEGRISSKWQDAAPRVVDADDGSQHWLYDGHVMPNVGLNAVAGRPVSEWGWEPARFDEMRRGAWDIHERIRDMDTNGVYASVNFPSFLAGFCGYRFQLEHDPALALEVTRAWNSYHLEEWAGSYPERIIPIQLPWLLDSTIAAEEIRRNAAAGFKAVSFSEGPDKLGLPSLHSSYWDPFLRACEETDTVVCLHFGSSGTAPITSNEAPPYALTVLFGANMAAAVDWLTSKIPVRFPDLKLCLSEGGVGWVPPLLDRLDHIHEHEEMYPTFRDEDLSPTEIFKRNFYVCAIDEPSAMLTRERTGVDHILLESDYPHADSTWPNTQATVDRSLCNLPPHDVRRISWENASILFRHNVPKAVQDDPDAY